VTDICIACGMPMETAADHALGDLTKDYCPHCARDDGSMQSYPEKLAGFSRWLTSTQGLDDAVARDQAARILGQLPAWRDVHA
jgi:Putative zinc ribbon domain